MSQELRLFHMAGEMYLETVHSNWEREHVRRPSLWLARDPDAEAKMLRDGVIGNAVDYRCGLVAGTEWELTGKVRGDLRGDLAVAVGTELIGFIKKFAPARKQLARACFHGSRYQEIKKTVRTLNIGDGKPRRWVVPVKLEDQSQWRFRKKVTGRDTPNPQAHWQRYKILGVVDDQDAEGRWVDVHPSEAVATIAHVYDETEDSLGYGRGLRERLGWPWYALSHVNQEAIGAIEKWARGWVLAKVHGAAHADTGLPNSEVVDEWVTKLEKMQSRHVMVMTKDDEVETLNGGAGGGWQMIESFCDRLERQVDRIVLAATLPTGGGSGDVGSLARAGVEQDSTSNIVDFDRQAMEECYTDDLLGALWFWNWPNLVELGIQDSKPCFCISKAQSDDPTEFLERAERAHGMGVDLSAAEFYEKGGLSKPLPDEEIIPGGQPAPDPFGGGGGFGPASDGLPFRVRNGGQRRRRSSRERFGAGVE